MKVGVYNTNGERIEEVDLPKVFQTDIREDIIKRAFLAECSWKRQPYGTDRLAGKRTSAHYHGRRGIRFTMMGREMARLPRIHGRSAGYLLWVARFVPQAVKGRRAHPPKVEKKWKQKINAREYLLAIKSALAACTNIELVKKRGHKFDGEVPIVFNEDFEKLKKAKDVEKIFIKLGLDKELERGKKKKVRAGKGKMRSRKYRKKRTMLIVFSKECDGMKACRNLPGVDVTTVDNLNVELLAPGAHPGRLLVITKPALEKLTEILKTHKR
jgi:large subunit ribosomal protein L4e